MTPRVNRVLAMFVLSASVGAVAETDPQAWKPLYERVDADLQAALEARIAARPQWQNLVQRKRLGVCVVDMAQLPPRFARVNGNVMMYAASLPKIAILLGAYASLDSGTLQMDDALAKDLTDMIRVSSNAAATRVLDRIGMRRLQVILRDPKYGFYDESRGGGLWVGKRYAKQGPRIGDPQFDISHGATPTQVCRFYYLLATGRLVSPAASQAMLEHLSDPALHHKFVGVVEARAPRAKLFRKSGTWRNYHSDSIMVRGERWRDYILAGIVQADQGESILRELLVTAEDLLRPGDRSERRR